MTTRAHPGRPAFLAAAQVIRATLPTELRERLRAESQRLGITESALVREALEARLAGKEG
jgi:predicted DNA-binding protein